MRSVSAVSNQLYALAVACIIQTYPTFVHFNLRLQIDDDDAILIATSVLHHTLIQSVTECFSVPA